jgi:hypothetical protein
MKNWEKFEVESEEFLKKILEKGSFQVLRKGGTNSNETDIEIIKDGKPISKLEVKLSPSQSGQIVVFQEEGKFKPSKTNNKYSLQIIDELNSKKYLENLGLKPVLDIQLNSELIFNWIKYHYKAKGVTHLITSSKTSERYFSIIDINQINIHFKSKATLRIKRSGTRDIPSKNISGVMDIISEHLNKIGYINEYTIEKKDKKLFIRTEKETLDKTYIEPNFYISKDDKKNYVIKLRSKTENLNIIFGLEYIGKKNIGIENYIEFLNKIK